MLETPTAADSSAATTAARPRHWGRWLLVGLLALVGLVGAALLLLDPWLRRTLEKQVAKQTHGQYSLQVGELHTSLWSKSIRLGHLRLHPAAQVADTLPRLRLDLAQVHVTGVGLWALLRKQVVPIDSVVLDSAKLEVLALPRKSGKNAGQPWQERLPLHVKGLQIGYFGLLHAQGGYQPDAPLTGRLGQATLTAQHLLMSPAGAADTQRVAFAQAWQVALHRLQVRAAGHRISFGQLRFTTASRRATLDSLRIREPAPGQGKPGAVRINFTENRVVLTGLRAAEWQHQRRFRADSLLFDAPDLAFTPPAKRPPDLWKLLAPLARRSDLAYLAVRHGHMKVNGLAHAPTVETVDATGFGIRIDSAAKQMPARIAYARAWKASLGGLAANFEGPEYRAKGAHLHLNTTARTIRLTGLSLTPHFTPVQMNLRHGYQIPQFSVRVPELAVAGLDFATLIRHGDVHASRATVRGAVFHLASDGRGPINPHRSIITPEEMRKVHTVIDVRRLDLVGGNLYTRYRSPLSPVIGTMNINRFSGTLYNVSNDPRHQTTAHPLTGTATAYLQNQCRMTVHAAIPLLDPSGRHRVWGNFGAGAFSSLNAMTVPTRLIEFKKGQVQRIDFALQADKKQVTGTMTARYSGLQLELLSYKKGEVKQSLGKKIISKAANVLVIRDENPRKGGRVVTGDMTSKREPRFSVFVLWRQGVVSGLLNNIGLPKGIAQKISQSQDVAPLPPAGSR
ncbi:AsmA family protein [Hymenobacter rubidus]|uniref:hypothetical protein n=1 Tax=Hymenobacter rubidus TaxID=1441626 RepID=UPI00191FBAE1|nr:hypothetical protein [Hymenobacter rubidus]